MRVGLGIRPVAGWVGLNIRPHQMAVNMELREKLMEKNNRKQTACDEYEQSNEVKKSRLSLRVAMVTDDEDSSSMLESSGDTCSDPECPECMADCSEEDFEMKSKLPVKKKIFSRSSLTGFPHLALKKFLLGMNSSEDSGYGYSHTDLPFGYTGKKENTDAFKSSPPRSLNKTYSQTPWISNNDSTRKMRESCEENCNLPPLKRLKIRSSPRRKRVKWDSSDEEMPVVENKRVKLQSFIRQMDAGMTFEPDQKSTEESVHEVVNSILNQVYLM